MNKTLTTLALVAMFASTAMADVTIGGKSYVADTVMRRQVGPGIMNTIIRLPEYPLNVYILETDLTNPDNRVESTFAYGQLGKSERLVHALQRNRTATKRPVAACNANFWVVSGQNAAAYSLGSPFGGVVRNDTTVINTNTNIEQWNGGPNHTGVSAIDHDKRIHMGHFFWTGRVSSPKIANGTPQEIHNINRRAVTNQMCLWNGAFRRTREFEDDWTGYSTKGTNNSDNYYLMLKEGESWATGQDMHFVVGRIVKNMDRAMLGDKYDACLTCTGTTKDVMSVLEVGDEIVINSSWMKNEPGETQYTPIIENLVEGNAAVLHNGELTNSNYTDGYNTAIYSRTAYGSNAEGNKLYQIVIDKSVSPKYGRSAGCATAVMCQILKNLCPDVSEIINYDAGGSAEMIVGTEVINTTTEGIARGVAAGWMVEAVGEEDNVMASIAFDDFRVRMPVYSSYKPKILGYNARGEIIDYDVQGFTLSCDPEMGTTSGNTFTASSTAGKSMLTAHLNGMTAQVELVTLTAVPAIAVKPFIVTDDRDYPIEVIASADGVEFQIDPVMLNWTIDDPSIATIENGVLKGIRNGNTHITCTVGDFSDETDVHVEISDSEYKYQDWTGWTIKTSGHKNAALSEDGTLDYTYGTGRVPYLALDKDVTFFGLPDSIGFTFTSDVAIDRVVLDIRNYNFTRTNSMSHTQDGGYEAGVEHKIMFDLETLGGIEAISTYPIELKEIRFEPTKGGETGAECTIQLGKLYAHYPTVQVLGDLNNDGIIDVADVNLIIDMVLGKAEPKYGVADFNLDGVIDVSDVNAIIDIVLGK